VILILGGTAEARELAAALDSDGRPVVSSLAGRVAQPRLPRGEVRIGGFGGPARLAEWLRERDITAIVDATHPFAERISASAHEAAVQAKRPLVRLERPGWAERPGDDWRRVASLEDAAALVPQLGRRAFLTSGRQGLGAFAQIEVVWFLIRCVDPPDGPLPTAHELILDRGPYVVERELELIDSHRIDLLVTKDSGGSMTAAKLDAARLRGLPVVVVDRPRRPPSDAVHTVPAALEWLRAHDHG
jgi:precorrin-6A/cobalt-precorrin-6A reductase